MCRARRTCALGEATQRTGSWLTTRHVEQVLGAFQIRRAGCERVEYHELVPRLTSPAFRHAGRTPSPAEGTHAPRSSPQHAQLRARARLDAPRTAWGVRFHLCMRATLAVMVAAAKSAGKRTTKPVERLVQGELRRASPTRCIAHPTCARLLRPLVIPITTSPGRTQGLCATSHIVPYPAPFPSVPPLGSHHNPPLPQAHPNPAPWQPPRP